MTQIYDMEMYSSVTALTVVSYALSPRKTIKKIFNCSQQIKMNEVTAISSKSQEVHVLQKISSIGWMKDEVTNDIK